MVSKYKSQVLQNLKFYSLKILFHINLKNKHSLNLWNRRNNFCSFFYINNESAIRYAC